MTVTKTAKDSLGNPLDETGQAIGNVTVALPPTLHVTMTAIPAVAGAVYNGQVATFTDDQPVPALENTVSGNPNNYYAALINWGDGTSSFGTIFQSTSAGTAFYVTGLHTYPAPSTGSSPYVASVSITKVSSDEASIAVANVTVADALLYPYTQGVPLTTTEGAAFSGTVGQFSDNNLYLTAANFNGPYASQTIINWGDGKTSVGTIVAEGGGVFDVTGSHVYASPTLAGIPDTISIAVTDQWGGKTTITNSMTITAAALTFTPLSLPTNPATPITEGKSFTSDVSLFTSANASATAGEYSAAISWGDGTPIDTGTIKEDGTGVFHVSGTHTYLTPGVYTITIAIRVVDGTIFIDPTTVTVSDAPILYTPPNAAVTKDVTGATITSGTAFTFSLGTLSDTNPNSTLSDFAGGASIDWGDGSDIDTGTITPTATPGQSYAIRGTHTYANAGNYQVTVTITDVDGSTTTNTLAITVAKPASTPAAPQVLDVFAQPLGEGSFLIAGQSFTEEVATFTSSTSTATASNFAASIYWGDGDDSPGTIVQGANENDSSEIFYVYGTHVYDSAGTDNFTVYVSTPGNAPVSDSDTATVSGAPLIGESAPIAGVQGTPLPDNTVVATFVDTAPLADPATFAANTDVTIDWGDGSGVEAVAPMVVGSSPAGTTFVVEDGHDYANITDVFQAYQVTVTIVSSTEGSATVVTDLANMTVPVLTDPPIAVRAIAGTAFTVPVATIHTTISLTTAADFTANITWGDGQTSSGTLQFEGGGTFEVFGSHTYANPGSFPISITLADNQGNTVTDSSTATVSAPSSPALATVTQVQPVLNQRGMVTQVVVTFGGPVDAAEAEETRLYRLTTAHSAKAIKLRSAIYDAADDTVTLIRATRLPSPSGPSSLSAASPRSLFKEARARSPPLGTTPRRAGQPSPCSRASVGEMPARAPAHLYLSYRRPRIHGDLSHFG